MTAIRTGSSFERGFRDGDDDPGLDSFEGGGDSDSERELPG
jgi:hypothetical protein